METEHSHIYSDGTASAKVWVGSSVQHVIGAGRAKAHGRMRSRVLHIGCWEGTTRRARQLVQGNIRDTRPCCLQYAGNRAAYV